MLSEAVASEAGKVLLPYVLRKVAAQNSSTIKNTQAGQAGAVPMPDTAPLTGAPHEAPDTVIKPEGGAVSNDNGFHWVNNQTMADVANEQMRDGHGTNGTSYDNEER